MSPRPKKSIFVTGAIRKIRSSEFRMFRLITKVVSGKAQEVVLGKVLGISIILSSQVTTKIIQDHGVFLTENLIVSLKDWEYIIKNVNGNNNKVNFIKKIPNSYGYFTIGANKIRDKLFLVTFYETTTINPEKLKNLLRNKGDALDRNGRAVVPSFATASNEDASQLDLSGVRTDN